VRKLLTTLILGLGIATTACAASSDKAETSQEDLSGSLASARACAIRAAYEAADLDAFPVISKSEVPPSIATTSAVALSKLVVEHVGVVYVVEDTHGTSFYSHEGTLLARVENAAWTSPVGALTCDGSTPPSPPPPSSGSASCDTTTVCTTGANVYDMGSLSGDTGAGLRIVAGYSSYWIKVALSEDSISATDLGLKATLTSPVGSNFDLFVHAESCGTPTATSEKPAGQVDVATVRVADTLATDDQFVLIEVRHIGADACDPSNQWSLTVEGNK
jgi:hypothetical protein